jgi:hypothetical protein
MGDGTQTMKKENTLHIRKLRSDIVFLLNLNKLSAGGTSTADGKCQLCEVFDGILL